jgi:hypothetical protein
MEVGEEDIRLGGSPLPPFHRVLSPSSHADLQGVHRPREELAEKGGRRVREPGTVEKPFDSPLVLLPLAPRIAEEPEYVPKEDVGHGREARVHIGFEDAQGLEPDQVDKSDFVSNDLDRPQ